MIFDRLDRAHHYRSLSPLMTRAIDFALRHGNERNLAPGHHEIDGQHLYGVVHEYQTKPADQGKWEAHRRYIDLQLMLAGQERMDVADVGGLAPTDSFDAERDVGFFQTPAVFQSLRVLAGTFAIFFPHDAHRPTLAVDVPEPVRKLVLKIQVDG